MACRTIPAVFAPSAEFAVAAPAPEKATVRVGDSDRERTAARLGRALTEGYLPMADYEVRLAHAFDATTAGELRALTDDLPTHIRRHDPRREEARARAAKLGVKLHTAAYVAMVAIVLVVWACTAIFAGATYFWPVWPILGAGIGLLSHALPVRLALKRVMS